jgi:EmrB/QacA subfamily drug resistance transporter
MSPRRTVHPNALLLILCTATFMSSLDVFIVNVGLRAIGADVGARSLANLSWVLNAYAIVFAALLVPAGRLADRYGNKQWFILGLALFTAGSLGCALSGNLWLIVGLRCLQAVGAAALVPTSLGLILTAIPVERRPHAIQIWAVSGSLGAAAGPALGGLLVQLSWRWIFILNVPIGIAALIAAALLAPDIRHNVETRRPDLLGGGLLMIAIGALALALVQGPTWGWTAGSTVSAYVVAVVGAGLFIARSRRAAAPIIDFGLFGDRAFAWANVANFLLAISFGIQLLGLVFWLQEGWGWSALSTGLGIAAGPVMVSITAIGLRRFTRQVPPGWLAAGGCLLMGGGGLLIGLSLTDTAHYAREILPGWLIIGAGVGFALPTLVGAATAGLPAHQTSTGSAVVQMGRQIGSVLGVALLVVVLGSGRVDAGSRQHFVDSWWWAALFAGLALLSAIPVSQRRSSTRSAQPDPALASVAT